MDVTVREIREFVNHCRELCSLMNILTRDPLWGEYQAPNTTLSGQAHAPVYVCIR
jgi:hypothetical protein